MTVAGGRPLDRSTGVGQGRSQLSAGADPELGEHLAQVPLDGARAEEQVSGHLGIRVPLGSFDVPNGTVRRLARAAASPAHQ